MEFCFVERGHAGPSGAEAQDTSNSHRGINAIGFLNKLENGVIKSETSVNERVAAVS